MRLVDDDELAGSPVVANRAMNRTRRLTGRDGYSAVLGFDILAHRPRRWLDLCCGSGLALFEAAGRIPLITGVDLVDFSGSPARSTSGVRYLGADKDAGPNYTGQAAVHSHYGDHG